MLTVVSFLWGSWCGRAAPIYVHRMNNMLLRHLHVPFNYRVIADVDESWRGNLKRVERLFRPDNGLSGRVLVVDLDTVIVSGITDLVQLGADCRFLVLEDFYQSRLAGGGLYLYDAADEGLRQKLYKPLSENRFNVTRSTRGRERLYFRETIGDMVKFWQDKFPGRVVTFKPTPETRLLSLQPDTSVVCFHGSPRPHEVLDIPWIAEHWR